MSCSLVTLGALMNKSNAGMIADTHTYNTTEFILPANCPKQTPDGFSVPGRGGLAALPGDRRGGREGEREGGWWQEWESTAEGPYLAKRITSLCLASRLLSVDKNSLSPGWMQTTFPIMKV